MTEGSSAHDVMKVHAKEADKHMNHIENMSHIITVLTRRILSVTEEN
jgi:hypothetical protein